MLKAITWNIWSFNKDQIKSIDSILALCPDILCVQEASEILLEYLNTKSDYHYFYSLDHFEAERPLYLITLVKKHLTSKVTTYEKQYKTRFKKGLLAYINKWNESRTYLIVKFLHKGKRVTVLNCHLPAATGPFYRIKMFKEIIKNAKHSSIICGDLNIFAHPSWNWVFGWLFGFSLRELALNEQSIFDKLFKFSNLINAFAGKITYPFMKLQLDHLLLNHSFKLGYSQLIKEATGSDHVALLQEFEIVGKENH